MDPNVEEVIGAFIDGEPVDAHDLRQALSAGEGREYLIDMLALRGLVAPCGVPVLSATTDHPRSMEAPAQPSRRPRLFWTAAAAALVAVSTMAGFAAGRLSLPDAAPDRPSITVLAAPPPAFSIDVPPPTRVIQLQHGQDWTERSGGN